LPKRFLRSADKGQGHTETKCILRRKYTLASRLTRWKLHCSAEICRLYMETLQFLHYPCMWGIIHGDYPKFARRFWGNLTSYPRDRCGCIRSFPKVPESRFNCKLYVASRPSLSQSWRIYLCLMGCNFRTVNLNSHPDIAHRMT